VERTRRWTEADSELKPDFEGDKTYMIHRQLQLPAGRGRQLTYAPKTRNTK